MPFPVLAGIPWLAGVLASLFTALFTWFLQFFTKRMALVLAAVAILAAITVAFFTLIQGVITGLSYALPPQFTVAVGWVVPSNAPLCVSAIMTTYFARWAYAWQVRIVQYKLF